MGAGPNGLPIPNKDIAINSKDIVILSESFNPNSMIILNVKGAGIPLGKWIWSPRAAFINMQPADMDLVSFGFMKLPIQTGSVRLHPGFCPADETLVGSFEALDRHGFIGLLIKAMVTNLHILKAGGDPEQGAAGTDIEIPPEPAVAFAE